MITITTIHDTSKNEIANTSRNDNDTSTIDNIYDTNSNDTTTTTTTTAAAATTTTTNDNNNNNNQHYHQIMYDICTNYNQICIINIIISTDDSDNQHYHQKDIVAPLGAALREGRVDPFPYRED